MIKTSKEMVEALIKRGLSKRKISKVLGVEWATVDNWHHKGQEPEGENAINLRALYKSVCPKNGAKK